MNPDKVNRYLHISGVVLFLAGTLDPIEGSVLIAIGGLLLAYTTYKKKNNQRKFFLASFIMIAVGVIFMFYFSALGGFGGGSTLSWWWALLILPYPIGWLMDIVILIGRAIRTPRPTA